MITVFLQGKTFTELKDKIKDYEMIYPSQGFGTRVLAGPEIDDSGLWFAEVRRQESIFRLDKR